MSCFLFANPLALAALVLAYILLVVEMCIPGFGLPGVTGIILSAVAMYAMHPTQLQLLLMVLVYAALLCVALLLCIRSASKGRLSKSKLILSAVATHGAKPEENDLNFFLERTGVAHTPLRPAGIAEFDGVRLSVVSTGDFIPAGTPVRVERVEGKRIIVTATQA